MTQDKLRYSRNTDHRFTWTKFGLAKSTWFHTEMPNDNMRTWLARTTWTPFLARRVPKYTS